MKEKKPTSNFRRKKKPPFIYLIKAINPDFKHLSLFFIVVGFINIWIYLYRIDQLNLLIASITSPATLLSAFASMSIISSIWILLYISPALVFAYLAIYYNKDQKPNKIIINSLIISILLAILGAFPVNIANAAFIYYAMFYLCKLIIEYYASNNSHRDITQLSFRNLFFSFLINIPLIIILSVIYKQASLSNIDRLVKIVILLAHLIPVYIPILSISYHLNQRKKIKLKETSSTILLTTSAIIYVILMTTGGLFMKFNDTTMQLIGIRSDTPYYFNVSKTTFPPNWLEQNWGIENTPSETLWLKGYLLFQNGNLLLMCPQKSFDSYNNYIHSHLTFINNRSQEKTESSSCIILNKERSNIIKSNEFERTMKLKNESPQA